MPVRTIDLSIRRGRTLAVATAAGLAFALAAAVAAVGAPGTVLSHQEISATEFTVPPDLSEGGFGTAVATLGDLDGDGVTDLAVGRPDAGADAGEVWVLFMNTDGTVKRSRRIDELDDLLDPGDLGGAAVAGVGDFDGDGVVDLALGVPGASDSGVVWILFLDSDGTVKDGFPIFDVPGADLTPGAGLGSSIAFLGEDDFARFLAVGAPGHLDDQGAVLLLFLAPDGDLLGVEKIDRDAVSLEDGDRFGASMASLGDVDGEGIADLAVGAPGDQTVGEDEGAVWILLFGDDFEDITSQKIADIPVLPGGDSALFGFGSAVAGLGDLDGDEVPDLAVGVGADDDGQGATWVFFLNGDGTVDSADKITAGLGGFTGTLSEDDLFGGSLASAGDLDGDGIPDLVVGAPGDDPGALWVLFLDDRGRVNSQYKISEGEAELGVSGDLTDGGFGAAVADLGDLDGDGVTDLAVGLPAAQADAGEVRVLFMNADGTVKKSRRIDLLDDVLRPGDLGGAAVAGPGDLDGDGVVDLALGAPGANEVWILFMNSDGTVDDADLIDDFTRGLSLDDGDGFGSSIALLGVDGGGRLLAVGAPGDDTGGPDRGAVWLLAVAPDGDLDDVEKLVDSSAPFVTLQDGDRLGASLASLGDMNGNGLPELAMGAPGDDLGGADTVAVWVLFFDVPGLPLSQKISGTEGGFTGTLEDSFPFGFGSALAGLGDLDGDGVADLAAGVGSDDDGGEDRGGAWILFLNADGTVKSHQKISDTLGGFTGTLGDDDLFGASLASVGDLNGDGVPDLVAGAPGGDPADDPSALWVLFLDDGVAPPATAPSAADDAHSTVQGEPLTVTAAQGVLANDSDPNGDPLTAVNFSTPTGGVLSAASDGSFTYTPAASFSGTDSFSYQASDGTELSDPATVTIAVIACQVDVTRTRLAAPASGGEVAVGVDANGASCPWQLTTNVDWIVPQGDTSGTGTAGIRLQVLPNPGEVERVGRVLVGDGQVLVTQAASTCTFSSTVSMQSFTAEGGSGSFRVQTQPGCAWEATTGADWVQIAGGARTGSGVVRYTVAANEASRRRATLRFADQAHRIGQLPESAADRPAPPTDLRLKLRPNGKVRVRWRDRATNETGYLLARDGMRYTLAADRKAFTDVGPITDPTTCYVLQAFNDAGRSGPVKACLPGTQTRIGPSYLTAVAPRHTERDAGALPTLPVVRIYEAYEPWGEPGLEQALEAAGWVRGESLFVHPVQDLLTGIPAGTEVVMLPSASHGDRFGQVTTVDAAGAELRAFVADGGTLVLHRWSKRDASYTIPVPTRGARQRAGYDLFRHGKGAVYATSDMVDAPRADAPPGPLDRLLDRLVPRR